MLNKIKNICILLVLCTASYAQYFNVEACVLNKLSFENKKLAKTYQNQLSVQTNNNYLSDFITFFDKTPADSLSQQDRINGYLVKSVYYTTTEKYKNALENSILASRLSITLTKTKSQELSNLLQMLVYYRLNSFKNVLALSKSEFTDPDLEFQALYLVAFSYLEEKNFENCQAICENLINKKSLKIYDLLQVLKLYSSALEQDANYNKALQISYRADSLINPNIVYPVNPVSHPNSIYTQDKSGIYLPFNEVKNPNLFYNNINDQSYPQKVQMEQIVIKNNIGFLLLKNNELKKAETTFFEALALAEKNKNPQLKQQLQKNIGLTYTRLRLYVKAEEHYEFSEKISRDQNNTAQQSELLCIRAKNQYLAKNLVKARELCDESIELASKDNNYSQLSQTYYVLAQINAEVGDIQKSIFYSRSAQENAEIAKNLSNKKGGEENANNIKEEASYDVFANEKSELERIQFKLESSKRQQEIELIKKESQIKEAGFLAQKLQNEKAQQALLILEHELMDINQDKEFERIKKDRAINILQNKNSQTRIKLLNKQKKLDDEVKAQKEKEVKYARNREKNLRMLLLASMIVIGLIIFLFYRNLKNARIISATNAKLEDASANLKSTNAILENSLEEINKQSNIIEAKNNLIVESITYAKRIQQASLPKIDEIQTLSKDCFVLYKPKDIISGDFYIVSSHKDPDEGMIEIYIVADCTGHGVPGAMLSLLCSSLVRQALRQTKLYTPSDVLNYTNKQLKNFFRNKEDDAFKDGMDIACCMVDKKKGKLYFASAGRPLIVIKNGEAIELKGEKHHIGFSNVSISFEDQIVDIQEGNSVYLFTDGYTDQFSGETRKRFMTKNFRNLILSLQDKKMEEQGTLLDAEFEKWRGDYTQMDDVCVLGIKI